MAVTRRRVGRARVGLVRAVRALPVGGGRAVLGDLVYPPGAGAGLAGTWLAWWRWSSAAAAGMSRRGWPAAAHARSGWTSRPGELAIARRLQGEFGLPFPLVQGRCRAGTAKAPGCADLVISEYGASVWCNPCRWIPEAARGLRQGGGLVFMAQSTLARLCLPERGQPPTGWSVALFGLHRRAAARHLRQPVPAVHAAARGMDPAHGQVWPGGGGHDRGAGATQASPTTTSPNFPTTGSGAGGPRRSGSPAADRPHRPPSGNQADPDEHPTAGGRVWCARNSYDLPTSHAKVLVDC